MKHAKAFIEAVFPDTKVTEPIVIPEDIIPLYKVWCRQCLQRLKWTNQE